MRSIVKSLLLSAVCIVAIGCGGGNSVYRISAPDAVEPGKSITVAVSGSFDAGAKILWTSAGGRIEGAANNLTATFVSPDSGSATVLCTIITPGNKTIALDKQITVTGAQAASSSAPTASLAPPPAKSGPAGSPLAIENAGFIPSGWMGDYNALKVDPNSMDRPHAGAKSQKWSYKPSAGGGAGWAAVAWQYPERNWGDQPGRDWSGRGFHQVSVWARGVKDRHGILPKLQFKAGGGTDPSKKYHASFEVQGEFVTLTEDWKPYTLDLTGQDLRDVIAGFVFVIRGQDVGPEGATFYLDGIEYR